MPANVPFYLDYSKNATSYESIGLWTFFYGLAGEKDSVVRVPGVRLTAEIFSILRIQPVIGTFFTKEQNRQGADKVIVLTQSYWQTQYGESPEVLGKEVRIGDEAYKPFTHCAEVSIDRRFRLRHRHAGSGASAIDCGVVSKWPNSGRFLGDMPARISWL